MPENHLALFCRFTQIGERRYVNRFKDGEKRRNRLFIDGCIIRKIKPEVTIQELFYNLIHRVYWYYDNSDGILSNILIAVKSVEIMEYPVEEMEFKSLHPGKVTTSVSYCRNHNVSRKSYSRRALQYENYKKITEWFEPEKSIPMNLAEAKEKRIKISRNTLVNYCKFMGIQPVKAKIPIADWYDNEKSISENLTLAKEKGIIVYEKSLYRYCKRNHIPTQGTGISGC